MRKGVDRVEGRGGERCAQLSSGGTGGRGRERGRGFMGHVCIEEEKGGRKENRLGDYVAVAGEGSHFLGLYSARV